jgi:glycosyltransferase involved in cell wall biosynthesis
MAADAPSGAASPLSILLVASPFAPVGPDAVGSAEQLVSLLDEALAAAGHRSIVIAPEGSVTRGVHLATQLPRGPFREAAAEHARRRHRATIARALREHRVDLVHLHGADFERYLPAPGLPVLVTLHLPPAFLPAAIFRIERPATFLHPVSVAQAAACPEDAFLLPPIAHGVAVERYRLQVTKRGFALAIGRVSPEKGYHLGLAAAARAATPVLLAGTVRPLAGHERYFREAIAPRLGGMARFLGPVGGARKRRLIAAARCLLVPSLVAEPSSLVAMEALASGTPVVAFRRGALGEIVEHGVTGFLVDDVEGMADGIRAVEMIEPAMCRRAAEERFSAARMGREYLATYASVISAARCAAALTDGGPQDRAAGM